MGTRRRRSRVVVRNAFRERRCIYIIYLLHRILPCLNLDAVTRRRCVSLMTGPTGRLNQPGTKRLSKPCESEGTAAYYYNVWRVARASDIQFLGNFQPREPQENTSLYDDAISFSANEFEIIRIKGRSSLERKKHSLADGRRGGRSCGSGSNTSAEGARIEAPKALRGGCKEGVSLPAVGGLGRGPPQKNFEFFMWKLCILIYSGF